MLAGMEASMRWLDPILLIFVSEWLQRLRRVVFVHFGTQTSRMLSMRLACRFRKPYPIDSRSAANQNMIAA
jgi:hypothetical protein